jgi:hypothetical protein
MSLNSRAVLVAAAAAALALTLTLLLTQGSGPTTAGAADHLDAPGLTPPGGDLRLDLTDVYAFRSGSGKTVLVMNVNGLTKAGQQATFATDIPSVAATQRARYVFYVDNNGDARPDVTIRATFGKPDSKGIQTVNATLNGAGLVRGRTTGFGKAPAASQSGKGARLYAGMRDDPFFFDLDGFVNILSTEAGKSFLGCTGSRPDKFAGSNVSSIVLELPSSLLTRGSDPMIGVWAATLRGGKQIDRMARPAIATVFIPQNPFEHDKPYMKNQFNATEPARDRAKWRPEIVDSLKVLFSLNDKKGDDPSDDLKKINGLADVLLPDILTFDTSKSAGFLNGRRPADDVIDAELNLVTEGAVTTDCVGHNDVAFPTSFPYLAAPHA